MSYYNNKSLLREKWHVAGIYDSNMGDAKKFNELYGEFVLSWKIYSGNFSYANIDGLSLNVELHTSIKNTSKVIKSFIKYFSLDESNYLFQTFNKGKINYDSFLNDELNDAYRFYNKNLINAYCIGSIILFLSMIIIVIMKLFAQNNKYAVRDVFLILFVLLLFCFGMLEIILIALQQKYLFSGFKVFYGSMILPIIYFLIIFYLYAIKSILLMLKKENKEGVEDD